MLFKTNDYFYNFYLMQFLPKISNKKLCITLTFSIQNVRILEFIVFKLQTLHI